MSKSIRMSDELFEDASKNAKLFHRSPPQQIEHWAKLGKVMESALSYKVTRKSLDWGSSEDLTQLFDEVDSPAGKSKALKKIKETSTPSN